MARLMARMPSLGIKANTGIVMVAVALASAALPAPVLAQDADTERRVEQIERQLRALQRAVFPGGDARFFEPEITADPANPQQPAPVATPSASAMTDVLARLTALESEIARLTAATEVNQNALSQLEERIALLEGGGMSGGAPATTSVPGVPGTEDPMDAPATPTAPAEGATGPSGVIPVPGTGTPANPELPPVSAQPSPERVAGVQAITKPASGDEGDDEYVYGFRLWEAGYYDEAQQQLALFVERYPDHWRTTYGRNLLGRAYLDDGEPRQAATHFYENYRDDPQGLRAPDSLLFLGEAMIALGDSDRACIALAEFGDTFPALATGRLQEQYDSNRNRVDCN